MNSVITQKHIDRAMSYDQYLTLVKQLLDENRTTGNNQSPAMLEYTKLNAQRMRRLNKTIVLDDLLVEKLKSSFEPQIWLVVTEAWCGDAAQNIPLLAKMAEQSENIDLKLILRDEYPEVIDGYLTNGGRAIPKLISLTTQLEEIGSWGPRPQIAQQLVATYKANPDIDKKVFNEAVQGWYAKDKTKSMQQEFIMLLDKWLKKV